MNILEAIICKAMFVAISCPSPDLTKYNALFAVILLWDGLEK